MEAKETTVSAEVIRFIEEICPTIADSMGTRHNLIDESGECIAEYVAMRALTTHAVCAALSTLEVCPETVESRNKDELIAEVIHMMDGAISEALSTLLDINLTVFTRPVVTKTTTSATH